VSQQEGTARRPAWPGRPPAAHPVNRYIFAIFENQPHDRARHASERAVERGTVTAESGPTDAGATPPVGDDLALRSLVAAVAHASDTGTLEEFAGYWTDDAVLSFEGVERHGREAMVATAAERRRAGLGGPGSHKRHLIGSLVVRPHGGDEATIDSYVQLWQTAGAVPEIVQMVTYHDTARRGPHGWRLSRREVTR
jgi:SnoaL-like domain